MAKWGREIHLTCLHVPFRKTTTSQHHHSRCPWYRASRCTQPPSATQLSQWSLRMRRHAKARTARHCAVWELVRPTRLTGADIWPGLYIVYVYSLQFHSHCSNLKQFEAAVALPSTGHVQVSVPWDTCSQPQGVSTPLCRVGSNDKPAGDSVWQQPGVEKKGLETLIFVVLTFEWRPLFRKSKFFAGLSDNFLFEGREGSQSPSVLRMTSDWF